MSQGVYATLAAVGVLLVAGGVWAVTDMDLDGRSTWWELAHGTDPFDSDSDGDGLPDGWEADHGLRPGLPDTDRDGLSDGREVSAGTDPTSPDSDGDGLSDRQEADADCDGDGFSAAVDGDDDGDGLWDGNESEAGRCDADQDDDGVPDGDEGNAFCILRADCDGDGLMDAFERERGYDPLDPDTFDTGIADAVAWAFQEQGQPPSRDEDGDGIPDGWESQDGLIDWGPFDPQPGRRDLLVEFVKVRGPDSSRRPVDLTPAYSAVVAMFAGEKDITLQWTETTVRMDTEQRLGFLDTEDKDEFLALLDGSRQATNPFVTSVLLNPQQEQGELGDILGVAFLRSMLAVVDYGAHTDVVFAVDDADGLVYTGDDDLSISPIIESHVVDADLAKIRAFGYDEGGILPDGRLYLRQEADNPENPLFGEDAVEWTWMPNWFQTGPNVTTDDGSWLRFRFDHTEVRTGELAATIAHEIGHTLGLCHAHEPDCFQDFPRNQRNLRDTSTMSYFSHPEALHFLPVEWGHVLEYLTCPPEAPIRLVAEGADDGDLLEAKYGSLFDGQASGRACGAFTALEANLQPDGPASTYTPAGLSDPPAPRDTAWISVIYAAVGILLAGLAAWSVAMRAAPSRQDPPGPLD